MRRMHNDMVILFQSRMHKKKYRFLRAGVDENLFGLNRFVNGSYFLAQGGMSLRFGVAQPGLLELFC